VHVWVALVADSESAEVVEVSEAALDDPALASDTGAVGCATAGDDGSDPESPQEPTVLVEVIATISENTIGFLAWPATLASDRP
jgi:hypothetical protein